MARPKIAALGVEAFLVEPSPAVHVSALDVEVFVEHTATSPSTPTGAGISAFGVEAFHVPTGLRATVSALDVEVFYLEYDVPDASGGDGGAHSFGSAS